MGTSKAGSDRLDREALEAIRSFTAEHGYPPSYADIGLITGKTSRATIKRRIHRLHEKGWIRMEAGSARTIVITDGAGE